MFNKGIIEQIGTPNEVYNHSQTEFVCNFIGDINRLNDDTVSALRAAGAEVDASKHNYIRLERLHVNVAPRGGEIALDGTVESCEYYGSTSSITSTSARRASRSLRRTTA